MLLHCFCRWRFRFELSTYSAAYKIFLQRGSGCRPLCRFHTFLESASLPVTAVTLPVTETTAAGGARLEGQKLVESGPSVHIGFVIGINRN